MFLFTIASALAAPTFTTPSLLPGDDTIGPAAGDQWYPMLVEGDGEWLLLWEDTRATLADTLGINASGGPDIYGVRLDADGLPIDLTPFAVASESWLEDKPRAAFSDGTWLVAYEKDDLTAFYYSQGIYAKRVRASTGVVLDDDAIELVNDDSQEEYLHDVGADGVGFAVLWQVADGASFVLDGATVTSAGVSSGPIRVLTPATNYDAPWNARLEWNTDRYFIAWDEWGSTSTDIRGLLVDEDLDALSDVLDIATDSSEDFGPSVRTGDGGFYVAWQDDGLDGYWGEVQGTPVSIDGDAEIPGGENLSEERWPAFSWPEVAWTGTDWAVTWAQEGAFTTLVDTDGEPIEIVDASESDVTIARVTNVDAPDGAINGWDVATIRAGWNFGYDVETSVLSNDGDVTAPEVVTLGAPAQTHPDVAGDAGGYLLVAQSETGTRSQILAWRLDRRGVPIGTRPIVVMTGTGEIEDPAVAWNGTNFLVVWEEANNGTTTSQVWGKRVSRMGRVLDASPIAIVPGNDPAVAASGTDFLVVSSFEVIHEIRNIYGARVANDGSVIDSTPFVLGFNFAERPDVTGTSSGWVAGWERAPTHDSPYSLAEIASLSTSGVLTDPETVLFVAGTPVQEWVSVASDGTDVLVAFSDDGDIVGRFATDEAVPTGSDFTISDADNEQFQTSVAWNGSAYQVAWTDWRLQELVEPGEGDVYTTSVSTAGVVGNTRGLAVAADPDVPEGNPAVAGANGTTIFGWAELHEESPYASFRVETVALVRTR